jgi:hypothetical protein
VGPEEAEEAEEAPPAAGGQSRAPGLRSGEAPGDVGGAREAGRIGLAGVERRRRLVFPVGKLIVKDQNHDAWNVFGSTFPYFPFPEVLQRCTVSLFSAWRS